MEYLIVAATRLEVSPLLAALKIAAPAAGQRSTGVWASHKVDVLITGVGMMATAYHLGRQQLGTYDLIINGGVAGAFDPSLQLGETVEVSVQQYADLGVENEIGWWDLFDLQLAERDAFPFLDGKLHNPGNPWTEAHGRPKVVGVTVNEITATEERLARIRRKYRPAVEEMEGVAVHYACLQSDVPYVEWRAISNYVGERDKEAWKLNEAIRALNEQLLKTLSLAVV